MQESVALETIQQAGTMRLKDLIIIQTLIGVQIDSQTKEVNNSDTITYFHSQNFNISQIKDLSTAEITKAIQETRLSQKPTFIRIHTKIVSGTNYENKKKGHYGVLSKKKKNATLAFKEKVGLKNKAPFYYDQEVCDYGQQLMANKDLKYK